MTGTNTLGRPESTQPHLGLGLEVHKLDKPKLQEGSPLTLFVTLPWRGDLLEATHLLTRNLLMSSFRRNRIKGYATGAMGSIHSVTAV